MFTDNSLYLFNGGILMKFSWKILAIVEVVNLFCLATMFVAQQMDKTLPSRHSLIPGTKQRFLYMQDWWTVAYGDTIAVPLVANVFVYLVINGHVNSVQWGIFAVLSLILTVIGINMCLTPEHKPDQGFPTAGRISLQGALHMPYFGIGWSMGIFSLLHTCFGHVTGPVLWLGVFGGAFYLACLVAEFKSGNFDPLKPLPKDIEWSGNGKETCYTCGKRFLESNPDGGGGVCRSCWIKYH